MVAVLDEENAKAGNDLPIIPVEKIDQVTGELLSPDEISFRTQVHEEATRGFIAVDTTYASLRLEIHQPMVPAEHMKGDGETLTLRRPETALQLPLSLGEPGQDGLVELLRHSVGDFPARVMHNLYAIANDPPYYRRSNFRVSISDLLDRLGYMRDRRGIHYSTNRKQLTRTLFALHLTRVEVTRKTSNGRKRTTTQAFSAPLLSSVGYLTNENVGEMNVKAVFDQGLPEVIEITINQKWYEGVRREDGRPGKGYQLMPRPTTPQSVRGRRGPKPGGAHRGQSRTADLLRVFIQRCKVQSDSSRAVVARTVLLEQAGITNSNISMAMNTLRRALTRLVDEGTLTDFTVKASKTDEVIELLWTTVVAAKAART